MLIPIANDPMAYAWGSTTAIPGLLGHAPSGGPEAELWLGAHPGSPARILDVEMVGGYADLRAWIEAEPELALGPRLAATRRLPFLLKVLAAETPLSLQAHPTAEQAASGFERENREGVPLDAPNRSYRDPHHKPELIVALSEEFQALCGFRSVDEVRGILDEFHRLDATAGLPRPDLLGLLAERLASPDPLRTALAWILGGSEEATSLVTHLVHLAGRLDPSALELSDSADALATVRELAREYPGDPGIAAALLVQRVTLDRGEALFLPAGNVHAYLHGLGIELMAASDNVLRGGLTTKHIDVPELLDVLDFRHVPVPYLVPEEPVPGVRVFRPDVPDFALVQVRLDGSGVELPLDGPAIVLATRGTAALAGRRGRTVLRLGESRYVTPDERRLLLHGEGEFFVATTGCPCREITAVARPMALHARSGTAGMVGIVRRGRAARAWARTRAVTAHGPGRPGATAG